METGKNQDRHCSFCGSKFKNKSKLEAHMRTHTREKPFICDKCKRGFLHECNLREHMRSQHQNEKKYKCSLCPYETQWKSSLDGHIRTHTNERNFACEHPGCEYAAKSSRHLKIHVTHRHENERKYLCPVPNCDYRGKTKMDMYAHSRKHSDRRLFACDFKGCKYQAKTKKELQWHKLGVHNGGLKPFACSTCDYRAPLKSYVKIHERTHANEKSVQIPCPKEGCTFQARNKKFMKRHLQFHDEDISCPVQGCGHVGTSSSSSSWKYHLKAHDISHRPFPCPLCPKCFLKNKDLSAHLRTHTQERPFQCPQCDFAAGWKPTIMQHMRRIHPTMSSKFDEESNCDHCGINYGCAVGLALHRIKLNTPVVVLRRLQLKFVV